MKRKLLLLPLVLLVFAFANAQNVGIGTTSPLSKLDVNGTINTGKPTSTNGVIQFSNSSNSNTVSVASGATSASYTLILPTAVPASGQVLSATNSTGTLGWATPSGGGSGTVTSVGLALPGIFTVSGSPITTSGSLIGTLASQTANTVFAAPNGSAGAPTFRALVAADLPGSYSGFATPTGSIGLVAVAGSATTAIRSDGTPALSQAIVPTWTGTHTFNSGTTNFSNATSNVVIFGTGSGAPAFTTRSVGTKIVLNSAITSTSVDYGIGTFTTGSYPQLWNSIPKANATNIFAWYAGTTTMLTIGYSAPFFAGQGDVSAYQYYANYSGFIYNDIEYDLDEIDHIRPEWVNEPKYGKMILRNDPKTLPESIIVRSDKGEYGINLNKMSSFSFGAIRMLRREAETRDKGLEAKIEQLQKMVEDLAGKKIADVTFVEKVTAYKGMSNIVVADGRVNADSKIVVSPLEASVTYHIAGITKGAFSIVFDSPLSQDVKFNYSSTLGKSE